VRKTVSKSGDWDMTQRFLFDGWRIAEVRDGGNALLQQYVWGTQYIDELVQIRVAPCPWLGSVAYGSHAFAVCQDANYNVLGVVAPDAAGGPDPVLVERYEYTPYGRRTPYASGLWWQGDLDFSGEINGVEYFYTSWLADTAVPEGCFADADGSGDVNSADEFYVDFELGMTIPVQASPLMAGRIDTYGGRATLGGPISPLGLCPFGHQGLFEDREWDQLYNRMRQGQPGFMRWGQPDPAGYVDGMNRHLFAAEAADPFGLAAESQPDSKPAAPAYDAVSIDMFTQELIDKMPIIVADMTGKCRKQYGEGVAATEWLFHLTRVGKDRNGARTDHLLALSLGVTFYRLGADGSRQAVGSPAIDVLGRDRVFHEYFGSPQVMGAHLEYDGFWTWICECVATSRPASQPDVTSQGSANAPKRQMTGEKSTYRSFRHVPADQAELNRAIDGTMSRVDARQRTLEAEYKTTVTKEVGKPTNLIGKDERAIYDNGFRYVDER
jgi:RHS repeat-associated protein